MRQHLKEKKIKYEFGATRSFTTMRFDLVPFQGTMRTAARYGLGAIKHGDNNWKRGGARFICGVFSHMIWHTHKLVLGIESQDDHLGAIGWAQSALAWFEANKPKEYKQALKMMRES